VSGTILDQLLRNPGRLQHLGKQVSDLIDGNGPICFDHLVFESDVDYRSLLVILVGLRRAGAIQSESARSGRVLVSSEGAPDRRGECSFCRVMHATDEAQVGGYESLVRFLRDSRLVPALFLGQRGISPDSVVRRAELMHDMNDIDGRSMVFFGDNDLLSGAVALRHAPKRVVVIDIDLRVLARIREFATQNSLGIETIHHDLYSGVPEELENAFDTFAFDPYPTPDASFEAVMLSRGRVVLSEHGRRIGYTFAAPTHKWSGNFLSLQQRLSEQGTVIRELLPRTSSFLPIEGELTSIEQEWRSQFADGRTSISHTKSLVRMELGLKLPRDHESDEPQIDRGQIVRALSSHYLLHAVGLDAQLDLWLKNIASSEAWHSAYEAVSSNEKSDRLSTTNLLEEILARRLTSGETSELLDDKPNELIRCAQSNGFDLDEEVVETLRIIHSRGYTGLMGASNPLDGEIYAVARLFDSYFRRHY